MFVPQTSVKFQKYRESKFCGTLLNGINTYNWNSRMRRENKAKEIFEEIMTKKFPKLVKDTKLLIKKKKKIRGYQTD